MTFLFILRRLIFVLFAIFGQYSVVQNFLQLLTSYIILGFLITIKPMNSTFLNVLEIINEVTLIICSYMLYLFTDYVDNAKTRYNLGWYFIGFAVGNIIINWIVIICKVIHSIV